MKPLLHLSLGLCWLASGACSDSHRGQTPQPPRAMQAGSGAGAAAQPAATAGRGGTGGDGMDMGAPLVLEVHITVTPEPIDGGAAAADRLCAGQCVLLEVVTRGGRPPYEVTWGDAAFEGLGPHRVCPSSGVAYEATVTDTPPEDDEFTRAPGRGYARALLDVEECDPPDGEPCRDPTEFALEPIEKWSWRGGSIWPLPLVGNLTDDNADGAIDAKDTPDVVFVARFPAGPGVDGGDSMLIVLDGKNGDERLRIQNAWDQTTPAIGDLDGDGAPEIVYAQEYDPNSGDPRTLRPRLAAVHGNGEELFSVPFTTPGNIALGPLTIALADLDQDGSPEIIAGQEVFDAQGAPLWVAGVPAGGFGFLNSPSAVDLDGDGYLEVLTGNEVYRHDGTLRFSNADVSQAGGNPSVSYHAVADFDGKGAPEIVVVTATEVFVLDAAGATLARRLFSGGLACPPTIGALGESGSPAILLSDGATLHLLDGQLVSRWSVPGATGCTGSTVFDFAGDGAPEVVFGDADAVHILAAADGQALQHLPRSMGVFLRFQYPVFADIDADGSADLLVVTSDDAAGPGALPALTVYSDPQRRWPRTRRVFNQETYHVTNVNDDGTIPEREEPHWRGPFGFRVQSWSTPENCDPQP